MKPQTTLRIGIATFFILAFLFSPLRSNETKSKDRRAFSIQTQVSAESSTGHDFHIDLNIPVNNKKEKENDHGKTDLFKGKRHADEDRHEHHHHHFDKVKHRKKVINILSKLLLKIFIAISYLSILLCTYMSICHS